MTMSELTGLYVSVFCLRIVSCDDGERGALAFV